jgi:hypothetical protein
MTYRRVLFLAISGLFLTAPFASADDEASNQPLVVASEYGNCYAKSIPSASYGNEGQTRVYIVETGADTLVTTYDWYANRLFLECNVADSSGVTALSVVAFGPWARGQEARDDVLALAFYWNGRLLRRYSTLDIARRPNNVSASVSHYSVIDEVLGYQWADGNRYHFAIRTIDNRVITFDPGAGTIVSSVATSE